MQEALLLCSSNHLILLPGWTTHAYIILVCLNFKSDSDVCPTGSPENECSTKLVLIVKTFFLICTFANILADSVNMENMLQSWTYFRYVIRSLQMFFRLNKSLEYKGSSGIPVVYIISGLFPVFFREDLDGVKNIQQIIYWCSMEQQTNYTKVCYRQQASLMQDNTVGTQYVWDSLCSDSDYLKRNCYFIHSSLYSFQHRGTNKTKIVINPYWK